MNNQPCGMASAIEKGMDTIHTLATLVLVWSLSFAFLLTLRASELR